MKATVIETLENFSGGRLVVDRLYGMLWNSVPNAVFSREAWADDVSKCPTFVLDDPENEQLSTPVMLARQEGGIAYFSLFAYRNRLVALHYCGALPYDELLTVVQHCVLSHERMIRHMATDVERWLKGVDDAPTRREAIPEEVQHSVWRRDQGCCVRCGSNERLEFDHIIPLILGGSNTERNIQLLCETCNRQKAASV